MSRRAVRIWALLFAGSWAILTLDYVQAGGPWSLAPYVGYLEWGE